MYGHTNGGGGGLSPRVRGNRQRQRGRSVVYGSIPACAGEPAAIVDGALHDTVYPRVCGGTDGPPLEFDAHFGLSPRVRGNPLLQSQAGRVAGSIPACAGEPQVKLFVRPSVKVYPRVCGGTVRQRQGKA